MHSMNTNNGTIINQLLQSWPSNTVSLSCSLESAGVYPSLANAYVRSNWLKRLGPGAFIKTGDRVDWSGGVYALQTYLKLLVHPGGKTALAMKGAAQYIPNDPSVVEVKLFGPAHRKLPKWFKTYNWNQKYKYTMTNFLQNCDDIGFVKHNFGNYELNISSRERAALEYCYDYQYNGSFGEMDHIISGLFDLRPNLVQTLLERCTSVKAKRLFMYLAEKHNLPCVKYLDLSRVTFGSGKRKLADKGHYNSKYKIVVPEGEQDHDY